MLAVEGDDTAWSYLSASFLGRDANELGAFPTGNRFCNQRPLAGHGEERHRTQLARHLKISLTCVGNR